MAKKEVMTTKSAEELAKLLVETRASLRAERFTAAGARAKDSSSLKKLRATVARILTEQRLRAHKAI